MFYSHGQVNAMRITFLVELENITISECSWVKATWAVGNVGHVDLISFQSNAWCKMPLWIDLLRGALAPFLTNLIKSFGIGRTDT